MFCGCLFSVPAPGITVSESNISEEVTRFLNDYIDSVLELEILLLLHADPARNWTAAELAKILKIDSKWAAEQLTRFTVKGIAVAKDQPASSYAFAPKSAELEQAILAVANAYSTHRVSIIALIFAKPTTHLRSFADAFRIRKEKE